VVGRGRPWWCQRIRRWRDWRRCRWGGRDRLAADPAPYVLVALAVAATILQQWAFHAGALQASVPIMLVGEPVVAVMLGIVVLGEHLTVHGVGAVALPMTVAAMLAATIALGRGEGAQTQEAATTHRRLT
ncbi:MAG: DMT family transporter, partial [Mycobacteriaceae bacterium]|nr:DMT family transporter [Mycobacteriaceae bacterium]